MNINSSRHFISSVENQSYLSSLEQLSQPKITRGLIYTDEGKFQEVLLICVLWEKLKGLLGGVDHSDMQRIHLPAMKFIAEGLYRNELNDKVQVNQVAQFAQRIGLLPQHDKQDNYEEIAEVVSEIFQQFSVNESLKAEKDAAEIQQLFRECMDESEIITLGHPLHDLTVEVIYFEEEPAVEEKAANEKELQKETASEVSPTDDKQDLVAVSSKTWNEPNQVENASTSAKSIEQKASLNSLETTVNKEVDADGADASAKDVALNQELAVKSELPTNPKPLWRRASKVGLIATGVLLATGAAYGLYTWYQESLMPKNLNDLNIQEKREFKEYLSEVCREAVDGFCKEFDGKKLCLKEYLDPAWKPEVTFEYGSHILCPVDIISETCGDIHHQPVDNDDVSVRFKRNFEEILTSIPNSLPERWIKALRLHQETYANTKETIYTNTQGSGVAFKSHVFCHSP